MTLQSALTATQSNAGPDSVKLAAGSAQSTGEAVQATNGAVLDADVLGGGSVGLEAGNPGTVSATHLRVAARTAVSSDDVRGSRCLPVPRRPASDSHRCTRVVTLGVLSHSDHAGTNHLAFTGGPGRRSLTPGLYRLTLVARLGGHVSRPASTAFAVTG